MIGTSVMKELIAANCSIEDLDFVIPNVFVFIVFYAKVFFYTAIFLLV